MTAIFPSRLWWAGWLLHKPESIDGFHWWIMILASDQYHKRGLRADGGREEALAWCERHCEYDYQVGYTELITFKSESDAILFKLAFPKP